MVRLKRLAMVRGLQAPLLAVALVLAAAVVMCGTNFAVAAGLIDLAQEGSIELQAPADMSDLQNTTVQVDGYLVATFNEDGSLTPTERFKSVAADVDQYNVDHSDEAAETLTASAAVVAQLLSSKPDFSETMTGGQISIEVGTLGLYLLLPWDTSVAATSYNFSPLLVPVPSSTEDGQPVYESPAELKGSHDTLLGSLEVIKSLPLMDATLGSPTFVFSVVAVDTDGRTVYNDVHALSFTEAGQKSFVIDNLAVGTSVTVTELYSGASYVVSADAAQTATISLEAMQQQVVFENKPNDDRKGGTGIENAFTKGSNGWKWVQRTAENEEAA